MPNMADGGTVQDLVNCFLFKYAALWRAAKFCQAGSSGWFCQCRFFSFGMVPFRQYVEILHREQVLK